MPAAGPTMQSPFGLLDSQFGPYLGGHESSSLFPKDFMGRPLDGMSAPWSTKVPKYFSHYYLTICVAL